MVSLELELRSVSFQSLCLYWGASFHSLDRANTTLGETAGDVRISLFPSLQCQLKSYSFHILFVIPFLLFAFQIWELLHNNLFCKNQIQCLLYSKCFINPSSLSKVNEKQ